jgi:hypothetical protein
MNIYNPIKPTYLYIKQHSITGLKYFGKTTRNPYKYLGSGKYWKRHILKHGTKHVNTLWVSPPYFDNSIVDDAVNFSHYHDIVNSTDWANLISENGLDGAPVGHTGHMFTEHQRELMASLLVERWSDPFYKEKMSQSYKNSWTDERKNAQSKRLTGKCRPEHSVKMKGRKGSTVLKGVPKPAGFGTKISTALSGKSKSELHKINLSLSKKGKLQKTRKKREVFDHHGHIFENSRRMEKFYSLGNGFYSNLDIPIRYSSVYKKLNIPYTEENRKKTKKELGFKFQQESV